MNPVRFQRSDRSSQSLVRIRRRKRSTRHIRVHITKYLKYNITKILSSKMFKLSAQDEIDVFHYRTNTTQQCENQKCMAEYHNHTFLLKTIEIKTYKCYTELNCKNGRISYYGIFFVLRAK